MPHYETMLYENDRAGKTAIASARVSLSRSSSMTR